LDNPFLLNLSRLDHLSPDEVAIVEGLSTRRKRFAAKTDIVLEGDRPHNSCLLLSGFAGRYNVLNDGRRQITAVHIAGEFVDLHSLMLAQMDHSVLALTECEISLVPHEMLRELTRTHPHLARLMWTLTVIDAAVHRQWLVAAGRLSSLAQVAHFLCEMYVRLDVVHQTDGFSYRLPLSQNELSDTMGLSLVHINRTLQELRRDGLIEWQGDQVRILDWVRLSALAEFDPTYLNLEPKPR
jgi:CRP-like cAMP-binding protein